MARSRFMICLLAIAALFMAAMPPSAQPGSIFRDEPPRPPADVPSAPPSNAPQPPPYYPNQRPSGAVRSDQPPAQPLPAPMSLPPTSRPGAGGIEAKPLGPPPGGQVAPLPPPQEQPQQGINAQPLPGLPPGVRQP